MNAIVLARLKTYLGHVLHYQPEECNAIISKVRSLALMSGHDIDFRFANAGLGVYHAGVEWKFWEGPSACAGTQQITTNAGNMLEALKQTNVVRCDEAAWRFLGLSFAGWNVLASLCIAFLGARAAGETRHPR